MEFDPLAAVVAGFGGTVVMSLAMNGAKALHMTEMPPFPLVMGTMMSGDRSTATVAGWIAHYLVMGAGVFGLAYAALFAAVDSAAWWLGLLVGLGHGVVVGAMAMPMMAAMHPRMDPAAAGGPTVRQGVGGEVRIVEPGLLGKHWGGLTPIGVLMGHAIFGVVTAVTYDLLV